MTWITSSLAYKGNMTWITTRLSYKSGMAWIYEAGAFLVSLGIEITQKWHRSQIEAASKRKRCQIKVSPKLTRQTFSHHLGALVWFGFVFDLSLLALSVRQKVDGHWWHYAEDRSNGGACVFAASTKQTLVLQFHRPEIGWESTVCSLALSVGCEMLLIGTSNCVYVSC